MRKVAVLLLLAVSVLSTTSFALSSHPPSWVCPLKNLKKNQLRGPDGTAFMPGQSSVGHQSKAHRGSARN